MTVGDFDARFHRTRLDDVSAPANVTERIDVEGVRKLLADADHIVGPMRADSPFMAADIGDGVWWYVEDADGDRRIACRYEEGAVLIARAFTLLPAALDEIERLRSVLANPRTVTLDSGNDTMVVGGQVVRGVAGDVAAFEAGHDTAMMDAEARITELEAELAELSALHHKSIARAHEAQAIGHAAIAERDAALAELARGRDALRRGRRRGRVHVKTPQGCEHQGDAHAWQNGWTILRCLDCNAQLPIGPSNDRGKYAEAIRVEVRAAEIAADIGAPLVAHGAAKTIDECEMCGQHGYDADTDPFSHSDAQWAGWLSRYIARHDEEQS